MTCDRRYTVATIAELQHVASPAQAMPSGMWLMYEAARIVGAASDADRGTLLSELFAAMKWHGVDVHEIVPCVLQEMT